MLKKNPTIERLQITKKGNLDAGKITGPQIFLGVQWLRINLPMQGTQVRSLVQEDFTCRGATKPPELLSPSATWPSTLHALEPVLHNRRRHRHERVAPARYN